MQPHGGGPAPASRRGSAPGGAGRPACRPLRPGTRRRRGDPVHGRRARRARQETRGPGPLVVRKRRRVASSGGQVAARSRRARFRHPGRRDTLLHVPGHHALLHGGCRAGEARLLRSRPAEPDRREPRGRAGASHRLRKLLRRARRGRSPRPDRRRTGGPLPAGAKNGPRAHGDPLPRMAEGDVPAGHPPPVGLPVAQHAGPRRRRSSTPGCASWRGRT
ncbi:MAG: hypothetical protein H6Q81_2703 [Deltaproteobacteria bacterium]|nr:hypothetical protein [Deltaproteobacteria bacterium]